MRRTAWSQDAFGAAAGSPAPDDWSRISDVMDRSTIWAIRRRGGLADRAAITFGDFGTCSTIPIEFV
jgi:hypothetical protein